jgi:hypothetical protein
MISNVKGRGSFPRPFKTKKPWGLACPRLLALIVGDVFSAPQAGRFDYKTRNNIFGLSSCLTSGIPY